MTDLNYVSRDVVAVLERLSAIETRLDVIISQHQEKIDKSFDEIRELNKRVDLVEKTIDINSGKTRIFAFIATAVTSAITAILVKLLTSNGAQ